MSSTSTSASTVHLCALCDQPAPKQCSSCHIIRYCSSKCQKADWVIHKIVCKSFKDVLKAPGPGHARIIYLPEQSTHPVSVWLREKDTTKVDEMKVDISDFDIAENHCETLRECKTCIHSTILNRSIPPLSWAMSVSGQHGQLTGDLNTSMAIIDQDLSDVFNGPTLFYARGRNLDTTDFCNVVDILRWEQYCRIHILGSTALGSVSAVTLNCLGDKFFCRQPSVTPYKLPSGRAGPS